MLDLRRLSLRTFTRVNCSYCTVMTLTLTPVLQVKGKGRVDLTHVVLCLNSDLALCLNSLEPHDMVNSCSHDGKNPVPKLLGVSVHLNVHLQFYTSVKTFYLNSWEFQYTYNYNIYASKTSTKNCSTIFFFQKHYLVLFTFLPLVRFSAPTQLRF